MANWLLDYIEMTEYIPIEFRDQSFLMRELDLRVSLAMNDLEHEIKEFFAKIDTLTPQEKQEQYEALLKKCDHATKAASDKVKMADRLHDLVEKSMRLLDQSMEKLKEDLLEGDKAYVVGDLEKRSQELDEKMRIEQESLKRQHRLKEIKNSNSKGHNINNSHNHRHSIPSSNQHNSNHHNHNHSHYHNASQGGHPSHHNRIRNNSTPSHANATGKQRKRERKRLNSAMTIFNRNSQIDDDSTNQTILSSPSTPDYLIGLQNSNSNTLNDIVGGDSSSLTIKGMIGSNKNITGNGNKTNGTDSRARQPILTAIDAAHAVSPSATNSDKLVSFSSNSNGDNDLSQNFKDNKHSNLLNNKNQQNGQLNQLGNHLLASIGFNSEINNHCNTSGERGSNHSMLTKTLETNHYLDRQQGARTSGPFSASSLSSRHDPILVAASQAINATKNMTPGRRTSSLKASYAAVNSGRLQQSGQHDPTARFDQLAAAATFAPGDIYCKCRNTIHDPMMIACDNKRCKYEWFHYQCVGITTPPEGEWYCDDCRPSMSVRLESSQATPKPSA